MNKENFYEWVNKSDYVSDDVKDYYQKKINYINIY